MGEINNIADTTGRAEYRSGSGKNGGQAGTQVGTGFFKSI